MTNFPSRRRWRYRLASRWWTPVLLILVLVLLKGVWGAYQKEQFAVRGQQEARRQLTDLVGRQTELAAEIDHLETERGQEEQIREKFSVVKAGEKVIVVLRDQAATTTEAKATGWWSALRRWWP